jgi:hypothetical protein
MILFEHILIQALFVVVENLMAGIQDKRILVKHGANGVRSTQSMQQ